MCRLLSGPVPNGSARLDEKSLELRVNYFWDKKAAGETRRRQKYYPGPFLCAELS